MVTKELSH